MKVQLSSASGNVVPPNQSGQLLQPIKIANPMLGQVSILFQVFSFVWILMPFFIESYRYEIKNRFCC